VQIDKINDKIILINGDMRNIDRSIIPKIDLAIVDPPYGIKYVSNHRTRKFSEIEGDDAIDPKWFWFIDWIRDNGALYCFNNWKSQEGFRRVISMHKNISIRSQLIWYKNNWTGGDLNRAYACEHENIWFATGENFSFWNKRPHTVIPVDRVPSKNLIHPTQKPKQLIRKLVHHCLPIDRTDAVVVDFFMGSGVVGQVAAERGYYFIGAEIDEEYYGYAKRSIKNIVNQLRLF
jgi:DNA modification methylase